MKLSGGGDWSLTAEPVALRLLLRKSSFNGDCPLCSKSLACEADKASANLVDHPIVKLNIQNPN